jgi:Family of unknown function (DUF5761)
MSQPFTLAFTNVTSGRVNLDARPSAGASVEDAIPGYTHQTQTEKVFENDMLRGNWESNPVSRIFFSKENITVIQNQIRKEVFEKSKPKGYVIDEQSADELKIIMRAIYYQYARNLPTEIKEQVVDLNQKVVNWSVPHILSAVDHYFFYLNDISHMPVPLELPPSMSSAGTRTLPLNPYM